MKNINSHTYKTYTIYWNRDDFGIIHIEARNQAEAEDLFLNGYYSDIDLNIKGGDVSINRIEEYKK